MLTHLKRDVNASTPGSSPLRRAPDSLAPLRPARGPPAAPRPYHTPSSRHHNGPRVIHTSKLATETTSPTLHHVAWDT